MKENPLHYWLLITVLPMSVLGAVVFISFKIAGKLEEKKAREEKDKSQHD